MEGKASEDNSRQWGREQSTWAAVRAPAERRGNTPGRDPSQKPARPQSSSRAPGHPHLRVPPAGTPALGGGGRGGAACSVNFNLLDWFRDDATEARPRGRGS